MNKFIKTLNLFIWIVLGYTLLVAIYGVILYNVGKIILYLIIFAVSHIQKDIRKYKFNKGKQ